MYPNEQTASFFVAPFGLRFTHATSRRCLYPRLLTADVTHTCAQTLELEKDRDRGQSSREDTHGSPMSSYMHVVCSVQLKGTHLEKGGKTKSPRKSEQPTTTAGVLIDATTLSLSHTVSCRRMWRLSKTSVPMRRIHYVGSC